MTKSTHRRLAAIEQRQHDSLPQLPALVVFGENNLEAKRAKFIATHGEGRQSWSWFLNALRVNSYLRNFRR